MFFYGYRYYDPETGRWPSREPIRELAFTLNYAVNYNTTIETIAFWFVSTSSTFVENDSLNYIDLLRLSKGGKQNISVNHNGTNYNKSSDPGDVRNAMNQAKQSGQSKAAKVLKGLLKVIKRGGGMGILPPTILPPDPNLPQPNPPVSPTCHQVAPCQWKCTCPSGYTPFGQTTYNQQKAPSPSWKCHDSGFVS